MSNNNPPGGDPNYGAVPQEPIDVFSAFFYIHRMKIVFGMLLIHLV